VARLSRNIDVTQVLEWQEGDLRRFQDHLAAEEPLEIRLAGAPLTVTMRTPGNDPELAAGFLFTEGLIQHSEQIVSLKQGAAGKKIMSETNDSNRSQAACNVVEVELRGADFDRERLQRNFFAASSCGICGKASIDAIRMRGIPAPNPEFRLDPEVLCSLPDKLRAAQTIFGRTGGLHAAGLFSAEGKPLAVREDVGRHNAVDKVVGWALLEKRLPLSHCVLMLSGRGGFEIIQKALVAGVPLVASVSAPSGLAVQLARQLGLTLVGFLRGRRFLVYSREERLTPQTG
jgi:FdhD protein